MYKKGEAKSKTLIDGIDEIAKFFSDKKKKKSKKILKKRSK